MALLIARALRDSARAAVLEAGGRGFVRFTPAGGALLATDAPRRCADEDALLGALRSRGFACEERAGLLLLTPEDALLRTACAPGAPPEIDWHGPLYAAQALARRWLRAPDAPLDDAGRRLVVDTLRLTGAPGADVPGGLCALRASAAAMLRTGNYGGMRQSGAVLAQWCAIQEKGETT